MINDILALFQSYSFMFSIYYISLFGLVFLFPVFYCLIRFSLFTFIFLLRPLESYVLALLCSHHKVRGRTFANCFFWLRSISSPVSGSSSNLSSSPSWKRRRHERKHHNKEGIRGRKGKQSSGEGVCPPWHTFPSPTSPHEATFGIMELGR